MSYELLKPGTPEFDKAMGEVHARLTDAGLLASNLHLSLNAFLQVVARYAGTLIAHNTPPDEHLDLFQTMCDHMIWCCAYVVNQDSAKIEGTVPVSMAIN